jgi:uncharacterized membrane protein YraQ (UPF0718 family)
MFPISDRKVSIVFDDVLTWLLLKLKDWGLLVAGVSASSFAMSMGLGWLTVFRRVVFSSVTALVIGNTCYYGFHLEFSISFSCGYFLSFLLESAFRQRLDAVGRAIADKAVSVINAFSSKKTSSKDD